jgi:multiple sugar transport system permease protein
MPDSNKWVLTVGIDTLTLADQVLWGEIMAASALAIVPPLLFVVFLQKYFLQGFRVTGMN